MYCITFKCTTPDVTHQTCRGSTGRSTQPALMTLKYVGAMMKMPVMKMLEWICLNCMCTELSKLSNYCPNVRNSVCSRVLGR